MEYVLDVRKYVIFFYVYTVSLLLLTLTPLSTCVQAMIYKSTDGVTRTHYHTLPPTGHSMLV